MFQSAASASWTGSSWHWRSCGMPGQIGVRFRLGGRDGMYGQSSICCKPWMLRVRPCADIHSDRQIYCDRSSSLCAGPDSRPGRPVCDVIASEGVEVRKWLKAAAALAVAHELCAALQKRKLTVEILHRRCGYGTNAVRAHSVGTCSRVRPFAQHPLNTA